MKKRYIISLLFGALLFCTFLTNPTEQDYLHFIEEKSSISTPDSVEREKKNFYIFSTYAPISHTKEYGIVYLGFMGTFFQISEGQYDYPGWLKVFD